MPEDPTPDATDDIAPTYDHDSPDFGSDVRLGEFYRPDEHTLWRRVRVVMGSGIWAYWVRGEAGSFHVVADWIYNPHSTFFAGMLRQNYNFDKPKDAWLQVDPIPTPPREKKVYIEDEDYGLPRWERRPVEKDK